MKKAVKLLGRGLCVVGLLGVQGPGRVSAGTTRSGGPPAPDTVLATVGSRVVGRERFLASWASARPPARSDSLTPESALRFLEALTDRELMAVAVSREVWTWSPAESASYRAAVDQLVLRAALDSVLALTRAALPETALAARDPSLLGIATRERITSGLEIRFDEAALQRLAAAFHALPEPSSDSSLSAQIRMLQAMPALSEPGRRENVASTTIGAVTAGEIVDEWGRLNPTVRPRIDTAEQVRDLVRNRVFQAWLRAEGVRRDLEHHPDVASRLDQQREKIAISHWVEREVLSRVPNDSAAARRHFEEHRDRYQLPLRYEIVRLVLSQRSDAQKLAVDFRDPAKAESLAARAERGGVHYRRLLSAQKDSALFEQVRAAGTGAVIGPDSVADGWAVTRVMAALPPRSLRYEEARERAMADARLEATERLLREALDRERRRTPVKVHREAVEQVGRSRIVTDS